MKKRLLKWIAGIVLDAVPETVLWAIDTVLERATSDRAKRVLRVSRHVADDMAAVTKAMEDGKLSDKERDSLRARFEQDVTDIKDLMRW